MVCFDPISISDQIRAFIFLDQSLTVSPIWDKYEQDELARISSIPPRNAFEEMIQWTNNGILWKFPIDNEQGSSLIRRFSQIITVSLSSLRRSWSRSRCALL